jgi:hypothetical protein
MPMNPATTASSPRAEAAAESRMEARPPRIANITTIAMTSIT